MKGSNRDSDTNRPRTIVVKLLRFKDKTKIFWREFEETKSFIVNDFIKAEEKLDGRGKKTKGTR